MTESNALDLPQTAKKPEPVILRSAHDYGITTVALETRVEDLKKLAKKTGEEGYPRESRAIQADADAIAHHILPSFRAQRELPLVSHETLEKEIAGALRIFVMRAFEGLGDPKVLQTHEAVNARRNALVEKLATRVALYAKDLADEAFNQGFAARAQSAESLALRAISTLRASD